MATTTENIYIKMNIDTSQFNNSMTGIKREMATLRGLVGNNLLSATDQLAVTQRLGQLKNNLDDVKIAANNIDVGDVFGNAARFAGVAANAVAGVTGAMSLLGVESSKTGEVEKKILQFMAIGNALQSVADSKRLKALAEIYGAKIKEFFLGKQIVAQETEIAGASTAAAGATGTQAAAVGALDTATIGATTAIQGETIAITQNVEALGLQAGTTLNVTAEMDALMTSTLALMEAEKAAIITQNQIGRSFIAGTATAQQYTAAQLAATEATTARVASETQLRNVIATSSAAETENTVSKAANTTVTTAMNAATIKAAWAQGGLVAVLKLASKAVWEFTVSLLANPIVWFAVAVAAVGGAIYGLIRILGAEERALKTNTEAMKKQEEALKGITDETRNLKNENDALTDRLLVNAGKLTEAQAKINEENRKYTDAVTKLTTERNKEIERIEEQHRKGEIVGDTAIKKAKENAEKAFNDDMTALYTNHLLEIDVIKSDADAKDKEDRKRKGEEWRKNEEERLKKIAEYAELERLYFLEGEKAMNEALKKSNESVAKSFEDDYAKMIEDGKKFLEESNKYVEASIVADNDAFKRGLDVRTNIAKEKYSKGIISEKQYKADVQKINEDLLQYEIKNLETRLSVAVKGSTNELELLNLLKNKRQELANVKSDYLNPPPDLSKNWDAEFNNIATNWDNLNLEDKIQGIAKAAQLTVDSISTIYSAWVDQQKQALAQATEESLNAISTQYDASLASIDNALKYSIISQEQYNKKKEELDVQRAAKEKAIKTRQWEQEKQYSLTQAIIGTAQAVINGLATKPLVPLGIIMAAAAGVAGAIQIQTITSQKAPTFAKGGYILGDSHTQGGVNINAEGGEYIVNKSVAQRPGMGSFLNKVNSGQITNINNGGVDLDTMRVIITDAVRSVATIPVINVESDTTRVQRRVSNIESKSNW